MNEKMRQKDRPVGLKIVSTVLAAVAANRERGGVKGIGQMSPLEQSGPGIIYCIVYNINRDPEMA